jgi:large subunit ribosomal protein L4
MSTVNLYNMDGAKVGELPVSARVFGVKPNPALVHEAVLAQRANARHAIANTKTRGEVRGGGKKPWKQKGTGRARQGSIRSPQWIGGGITFGPLSARNFSVKINRKAKQKALFMVLSDKVTQGKLFALESVTTTPTKTKLMATAFKKLPIEKTVLLISAGPSPELMRMVRNLPFVKLITAKSVSIMDVLSYRTVIFEKDALTTFEQMYSSSS